MNRRHAVLALLALGAISANQRVMAQAARPRVRVGILIAGTQKATEHLVSAFVTRLAEFGWVEGSTVDYVVRYAQGDGSKFAVIAAEVVAQKVDLVLAPFGSVAQAAMKLTKDVPIVFCIVQDPVAIGLVSNLGRPSGNVTGLTTGGRQLIGKRLQVLKEMVPSIRRLGLVQGPGQSVEVLADVAALKGTAKQLGIDIIVVNRESSDLANAMNSMVRERVDATIGMTSLHWSRRKEFPEAVAKVRLPAIYDAEEFVDAGGLIAISVNYVERYRAAAGYVNRILRGVKPQDLPVEEPTVFTTVINMKTAKALGLAIPQSILLRADRVIE